jgi:preprotein translocase subunit YajC
MRSLNKSLRIVSVITLLLSFAFFLYQHKQKRRSKKQKFRKFNSTKPFMTTAI